MKTLLAIIIALALTGCASTEYVQYAKTQEAIATAKGQADAARYKAMADIAASGDSAAKVAAVMALALGQGGAGPAQQIAAPAPNAALQWASVLVPALTQAYGIRANADVSMRSSDNAARTSIATTAGFVSLAGQIQAPAANVSTVTTTTSTDTASTVGANSGANSGNSGRLAGGYITDATSAPTVVTQPAPLIVTQPAPTVVTAPAPVIVTQPAPLVVTQPAPIVLTQPPPTIVRPEVVLTGVAAP
jgi:hypothetical protein